LRLSGRRRTCRRPSVTLPRPRQSCVSCGRRWSRRGKMLSGRGQFNNKRLSIKLRCTSSRSHSSVQLTMWLSLDFGKNCGWPGSQRQLPAMIVRCSSGSAMRPGRDWYRDCTVRFSSPRVVSSSMSSDIDSSKSDSNVTVNTHDDSREMWGGGGKPVHRCARFEQMKQQKPFAT
jgi:hypothetical protein